MLEQLEQTFTPETPTPIVPAENGAPHEAATPIPPAAGANEPRGWRSEAGRKGARRVHQLIQEGKLYEQEHGLKRGRQRRRQLIELGKRYEQEHGLRPKAAPKRRPRLARADRQELLTTLLQCLVRLARPSFRAELTRLIEALQEAKPSTAA